MFTTGESPRGLWELSVPALQLFCKSKTFLKLRVYSEKAKEPSSRLISSRSSPCLGVPSRSAPHLQHQPAGPVLTCTRRFKVPAPFPGPRGLSFLRRGRVQEPRDTLCSGQPPGCRCRGSAASGLSRQPCAKHRVPPLLALRRPDGGDGVYLDQEGVF